MTNERSRTYYETAPPAKRLKIYWEETQRDDDSWWMTRMDQVEANQLVKAIYENTMNSLKECSNATLAASQRMSSSHSVEIEAVTMAIRAHGLTCSNDGDQLPDLLPSNEMPSTSKNCDSSSDLSESESNEKSERDKVMSEAVAVAIQNKGLGAVASGSN